MACGGPVTVQVIESLGRTVTAELVDLDGDGRQDLMQAVTGQSAARDRAPPVVACQLG